MAIEAKAKPAPQPAKPRVSPGEFVRQVRAETAKVVWPTRRETIITTIMVLIMTAILSIFFIGVDQALGRIVKFLLSLAG
nr:preprotein translocase subunit SecE [Polymorphobacter sp.]